MEIYNQSVACNKIDVDNLVSQRYLCADHNVGSTNLSIGGVKGVAIPLSTVMRRCAGDWRRGGNYATLPKVGVSCGTLWRAVQARTGKGSSPSPSPSPSMLINIGEKQEEECE